MRISDIAIAFYMDNNYIGVYKNRVDAGCWMLGIWRGIRLYILYILTCLLTKYRDRYRYRDILPISYRYRVEIEKKWYRSITITRSNITRTKATIVSQRKCTKMSTSKRWITHFPKLFWGHCPRTSQSEEVTLYPR